MTDFATVPGAVLAPMTPTQMQEGFACGTISIERLNWLFQQLFGLVTSYTDCDGNPLSISAVLPTCAQMSAAIASAIAALPADKFLQGLAGYDPETNLVTLLMSDGSTVPVDLTGLVNDAVASVVLPTTLPPSGPAGGMLTGTYPNPGIDIDALAATLCGNAVFQACVTALAGGGGTAAPVAPAGAPFTDTGTEATGLAVTRGSFTGTGPITLAAAGLPAGVTFTDNGDGSWTLGGAWPAAGTYAYTVTATNVGGSTPAAGNHLVATAVAASAFNPLGTFAMTTVQGNDSSGITGSGHRWFGYVGTDITGLGYDMADDPDGPGGTLTPSIPAPYDIAALFWAEESGSLYLVAHETGAGANPSPPNSGWTTIAYPAPSGTVTLSRAAAIYTAQAGVMLSSDNSAVWKWQLLPLADRPSPGTVTIT